MGGGGIHLENNESITATLICNTTYILQISPFATPFLQIHYKTVSPVHLLYLNDYVSLVKQHITTFLGSPGGVPPILDPPLMQMSEFSTSVLGVEFSKGQYHVSPTAPSTPLL